MSACGIDGLIYRYPSVVASGRGGFALDREAFGAEEELRGREIA